MKVLRLPSSGTVLTRVTSVAATIVALTVAASSVTRAEVGVAFRHIEETPTLYVLGIVDGTDPIGEWIRFRPDGPTRFVLDGGAGFESPALLTDTVTGKPMVAWSAPSAGGDHDVLLSVFDGTGWSTPYALAATGADERDPVLVSDPVTGEVHLFYGEHGAMPRVMHRRAPAGLTGWTAASQVSLPGDAAFRPSAVFHRGTLSVVFEVHDFGPQSTPRRIVLATFDGIGFGDFETVASTTHPGANRAEVHSRKRRLWVDWIGDTGQMTWTRRLGNGPWSAPQNEPFLDTEDLEYHVRGKIKALAIQP